MGGQVGRGARRTREPVRRNNETIGELDGQGNGQGIEANRGVNGVPDISTIIAQQLKNLLPTLLAQVGNHGSNQGNGRNQNGDAVNENIQGDVKNVIMNNDRRGCTYKEFLACNPEEYDGKGESSGTESGKQDTNSSSGNDVDADDADIKPVYDKEPMAKIFTSSTTKVDNKPTNGSNEDISNQYECEQTLDFSAATLNISAVDTIVPSQQELDLPFRPMYDEFFNAGTSSVNKSSSSTENYEQQNTPPTTNIYYSTETTTPAKKVNAEENNDNQVEDT
ncbi:hypothetical protein Tco_1438779 [Tanacetum coccineum]